MARKLYNLARMDTATTGTGTITLGSNVTGFLSFAAAGVSNGEVVKYSIRDSAHSEIGYGTYTSSGTTLTRNVIKSTNSDSAISLSGSAEVFICPSAEDLPLGLQTIWLPSGALIAATTNGAASAQIEESSNAENYKTLDFDASTDEYAHFSIFFPRSWDLDGVYFQPVWSTTATDTDGVAWGLQGTSVADGDAADASWGTAVVTTDDAQSAANDVLIAPISTAVTIAGSPAAGEFQFFRFFRDVSDGSDTMAEDARLIGLWMLYTVFRGNDDATT